MKYCAACDVTKGEHCPDHPPDIGRPSVTAFVSLRPAYGALMREDKAQLNRIEELLLRLVEGEAMKLLFYARSNLLMTK